MTARPPPRGIRERPARGGPGFLELAELLLVAASVGQGLLLGTWFCFWPGSVLRAGGLPPAPVFFVRWAGVLHLVLALGYALEWVRFRRVSLLVVAKAATAVFFVAVGLGQGLPPLLLLAVTVESTMATAGALLHRPASRAWRARSGLRLVARAAHEVRPAGRR